MATKKVLAWHFLPADVCLANKRRKVKVEIGKVYRVKGSVVPCENGLHGSIRLRDALGYAPGPILCRVEHSGTIVEQSDKLASSARKVLFLADCSTLLHHFACDEAERALDARQAAGDTVDPRSLEAIRIKRLWLQGKASDAELDAARNAAWAAAGAAQNVRLTAAALSYFKSLGYTGE